MLPEVPLDLNNPQGERTVHAIVKEVLQQMNADISVKDSSRRGARRSVRSQNQRSIQEQKKTLPKGHDLAWKVGVYFLSLVFCSIFDFTGSCPSSMEDSLQRFIGG